MTKLITDLSALNAAIKSIAGRAKKLDQDIQIAGLSCLAHIEKHGDVRPLNALRNALGQGHRKNALDIWAFNFGKVEANTDAASKKEHPYRYAKEAVTNIEGAAAEPWYSFKPDQDPDEIFNVQKAVRAILAKAAKKNVEDAAFASSLREFLDAQDATASDPLNTVA